MDDFIHDFLVEGYENLDHLDQDLLSLEKEPTNREVLAGIFRRVHTFKGNAGFLGLTKLQSVAHVGENLLSKLRDGKMVVNGEITDALLRLIDSVRKILTNLEQEHSEGSDDWGELIATLERLQHDDVTRMTLPKSAPAPTPAPAPAPAPVAATPVTPKPQPAPATPPPASVKDLAPAATTGSEKEKDGKAAAEVPRSGNVAESTLRVDVGLLDKLMNLVGELVLTRNQILQYSAAQGSQQLQGMTQRLNLITSELQDSVMRTRMQPIDTIWNKVPRVVRDLAQACGKQARVEMQGKDVELDKSILEALKDPLTHILRNALDHGIEKPEQRELEGKAKEGLLQLRAYHENGQVVIVISDDGGGISHERVKQKAIKQGLLTQEQAARLGDREIVDLVFLPGFSTAEKVTNVSGRGVGMDVVKTSIERVGGSLEMQSTEGKGTTLSIKIPLTLAIIQVLLVGAGEERFAIPQAHLLEVVRVKAEDLNKHIEQVQGASVYRLRGALLPLVDLRKELTLEGNADGPCKNGVNIVVLRADNHEFGLIVDSVLESEEIVVKPIGKHLKGLAHFAGATILGDGSVALILDVQGLCLRAGLLAPRDRKSLERSARQDLDGETQPVLLVQSRGGERLVLPLDSLDRLEKFDQDKIEHTGAGSVVQYRGRLLPLIPLSDLIALGPPRDGAAQEGTQVPVIVYNLGGREVGVAVDEIVDILQDRIDRRGRSLRDDAVATTVIGGKAAEVLDLGELVMRSPIAQRYQDLAEAAQR